MFHEKEVKEDVLPVVAVALLVAKLKKQRVSVLLRAWALYPFFAAELLYIVCQISVLTGHYWAIPYASLFKAFFLLPLLLPIVVYRLYLPSLAGSACVLLGSGMNRLVIAQNGGKMPVFPTLSRLTGYFNESAMLQYDALHTLGNAETKFKFLADYIDLGYSILSLGDILIRVFIFLIVYYTILRLNEREGNRKERSL